ncbi:MAG: IS256 family transposase [Firmicutes bacterium]|nr:IS256 family transposase [Bacillota bacterium]
MAQVNITLSEEEIKRVLLGDRNESLRFLLEKVLNEVMKAESEEQIGAAKHERSEERSDYRNGTRERSLTTRIGTLLLEVPRHRNEPFHTMVFENYKRSEASLIATMVQMVISGVSTRKVSRVVETLCGKEFSKSTVSELCKRLDDDIKAFRTQPLDGLDAPFLMVDATYFKAREDHRIVSKAFMIALAIRSDGMREIVGFGVYDAEENYSWTEFLQSLKERGLNTVKMVISDAHRSIRKAIAKIYPQAAWQRCQVHLIRNILDEMPSKYREGIKTELRMMFTAKTLEEARKIKNEIVAEYESVAQRAMSILENGFEDSMTVMCLPEYIRIVLRTTNIVERLNRELKRRSDVIMVFPNAASVLRLMGAVTIEYSEAQSSKQRIFAEFKFQAIRLQVESYLEQAAKRQLNLLAA